MTSNRTLLQTIRRALGHVFMVDPLPCDCGQCAVVVFYFDVEPVFPDRGHDASGIKRVEGCKHCCGPSIPAQNMFDLRAERQAAIQWNAMKGRISTQRKHLPHEQRRRA